MATMACCALGSGVEATSVVGDGGLPYFTDGQPIRIEAAPAATKLTVKTRDGAVVGTLTAGADGSATLAGLPPGYYEVSDASETLPFVVTYQRKPLASVVALDAHLSEDWMFKPGMGRQGRIWGSDTSEIFKKNLIIARHSGAACLRERFRWVEFEPQPGQWTDQIYDYYFRPQLEAGFELIPTVEGLVSWADAMPGKNMGPPDQDKWKKLFATLSSKYADEIPMWQVWNEPDPGGIAGRDFPGGSTPDKFIESYLVGARASVDDSGKKLKLLIGGSGITDTKWNAELIKKGATKYVDAFAVHLYGVEPFTFEPLMKQVLAELDQARFAGPIMATEFDLTPGYGLPAFPNPEATRQAAHSAPDRLAQMYTLWFSLDKRMRAGKLFKFDLRDYLEMDCKMGIARLDYSPKPELAAMNMVAHRLAGATHLKTIEDGSSGPKISMQWIRGSDGKPFATLYAKGDCNVATFHTASPSITLLPATGGRPMTIRTLGGTAVVPVPNECFFYIDGAAQIDPCEPIIEVVTATSTADGTSNLKLLLRNPLAEKTDLKIKIAGSKQLSFPTDQIRVTLAASEQRQIDIPFSVSGSPPAGQTVSASVDADQFQFHADLPLAVSFSR